MSQPATVPISTSTAREATQSVPQPGGAATDAGPFDAILVVGFGGPEKRDDVMPFLENVLRGRNVPRERMLEVAAHYDHFDGVSPINGQMRALIAALQREIDVAGPHLPIYWGNRNWHPLLVDTLRKMSADGIRHALAYVASGYSSYSGCRQYREDIQRARQELGESAPAVDKIRVFYNHPRFITANADRLRSCLETVPHDLRGHLPVVFTAHSIPSSMARGCAYEQQLRETCRLTAEAVGLPADRWQLVYQSRSGRPEDPWLAPDILDHIRDLAGQGTAGLVVMPIGFLSDHMEVMYDLDYEALHLCEQLGLKFFRAGTVGTHPDFVTMVRELITERVSGTTAGVPWAVSRRITMFAPKTAARHRSGPLAVRRREPDFPAFPVDEPGQFVRHWWIGANGAWLPFSSRSLLSHFRAGEANPPAVSFPSTTESPSLWRVC